MNNKSNAFTLIELVTVLGILSIVMGISTMMLFSMLDFHLRYDEQLKQQSGANRLVSQFRDDVHSNGQPEILQDGEVLLQWQNGENKIVYTLENGEFPEQKFLRRDVLQNQKRIATERYALPDNTSIWFTEGKDQNSGLVAMNLWISTSESAPDKTKFAPFTQTQSNLRTIIAKRF